MRAYAAGYFPMDDGIDDDGPVRFYGADPRGVLPLGAVRVPRSLRPVLRSGRYDLRIDADFAAVIAACARHDRPGEGIWLSRRLVAAYTALHEAGHAHSFEAWDAGRLVGGLYGVTIGRAFMAESMFHAAPDAGSFALVMSAEALRGRGYQLFDVQVSSPHLARLGVVEVSSEEYQILLRQATRRAG